MPSAHFPETDNTIDCYSMTKSNDKEAVFNYIF